jgi:hypothetical protein
MPKVKVVCDQRFLKPHSDIEGALQRHGRSDAREIANLAAGPDPVFIEVDDPIRAKELAESLNQIADVRATVES